MMGSRMTIKEQIRHILESRGLTLREVKSPDNLVAEKNNEIKEINRGAKNA